LQIDLSGTPVPIWRISDVVVFMGKLGILSVGAGGVPAWHDAGGSH